MVADVPVGVLLSGGLDSSLIVGLLAEAGRLAFADRNLFLAVIAFLLIVGGGLIYLVYGTGALITGLACLLFGVGLLMLLWLILTGIERWANK